MPKHPLSEGSVGIIFKRFIGPLVRYKPEGMDLRAFWDLLFHAEDRSITRYVVTKPFKMPGLYCAAPLMKVQGIGYREVKVGDVLWVRTDKQRPEQIDVEWLAGVGKRDQLFELNPSEWGWVRLHLKERQE